MRINRIVSRQGKAEAAFPDGAPAMASSTKMGIPFFYEEWNPLIISKIRQNQGVEFGPPESNYAIHDGSLYVLRAWEELP